MPISKLHEMTWEEVRDLDAAGTVAILPVGAVEAHGPHLPLETDVIIAEAMAREGAGRIGAGGHQALVLPALAYTAAGFAASFPGTLSMGPETVTETMVEIARGLAGHGFPMLAVANAHLDPEHLESIRAAQRRCREEGRIAFVFPDVTRRPWAERLTEEFRSGACHAGRYEGSIVMAERPDLVRDEIRDELPANPRSLSEAIQEGCEDFEEAGGPRAYFGDPAAATAEEGEETIRILGSILEQAVLAELGVARAATGSER